jgi:hypothetical protein
MAQPEALPRWEPANDVERQLADAATAGDQRTYFRVLTQGPLYLPGFGKPLAAGAHRTLLTVQLGQTTCLLAFTSVPALTAYVQKYAAEAADGAAVPDAYWVSDVDELVQKWPDPAWRLALDPNLGIGAVVSIQDVVAGAAGEVTLPTRAQLVAERYAGFAPANDVERRMDAALDADDPQAFFAALATASLILPQAPPPGCAPDTVAVFTSAQRLAESVSGQVATVTVRFPEIVARWPDPAHRLAVNPYTALAVTIAGSDLPGLLPSGAEALVRQSNDGGEDSSPRPTD